MFDEPTLYGPDGEVLVEPLEARLSRELAGDVFEAGPEARVRALRETVFGVRPVRLVGLLEQLEARDAR
jgi:hypothetical protein